MLRLTRTAIGLLTAQYRSVLRKCWAINVGIFALGAVAATTVLPTEAEAKSGSGEITGGALVNTGTIANVSSYSGYEAYSTGSNAKGGAIYNTGTINQIGTSSSSKNTYNNNTARSTNYYAGGGAIYNKGGRIGNVYADFGSNTANGKTQARGGAIINDGEGTSSRAVIGDIIGNFTNNNASSNDVVYGGVITNWVNADIGNINGTYSGNTVNAGGQAWGAIMNFNNSTITSIDGTFTNNSVTSSVAHGGVIANEGSNVNIGSISGRFEGNTINATESYGGVISNWSWSGATIGTINANFINNSVTANGDQSSGGAIANAGGRITSISGNFTGNKAVSSNSPYETGGGAIFNAWSNGIGIITDSNFSGNYTDATTVGKSIGGAIWNVGGNISSITNSTFTGNYAKVVSGGTALGGAIYNEISDADATIITFNGTNTFGGTTAAAKNKTIVGSTETLNDIYNDGGTINISSGTTTLYSGYNGTAAGTLSISGGAVLDINENNNVSPRASNLGAVTNNGTIRLGVDVNASATDTFNFASYTGSGSIILDAIHAIAGAYTLNQDYTVLTGTTGSAVLTLPNGGTSDTIATVTSSSPVATAITDAMTWDTKYTNTWTDTTETYGVSLTSDRKGFKITSGNISSENTGRGDVLAAVNQNTDYATKSFTAVNSDAGRNYTTKESLGDTYGTLNVNGLGLDTSTLTIGSGFDGFNIGSGATVNLSGLTLSGGSAYAANLAGGTLGLTNVTANGAKITGSSGSLTMNGTNTINDNLAYSGAKTIESGTTTFNGMVNGFTNNGTVNVGASNLTGAATNNGTLNLSSGTLENDISGTGTTKVASEQSVINSATISSALNNAGTLTNSATISGATANTGTLDNNGTLSGTVNNSGTLMTTAGALTGSSMTNDGTLELEGGTLTTSLLGTGRMKLMSGRVRLLATTPPATTGSLSFGDSDDDVFVNSILTSSSRISTSNNAIATGGYLDNNYYRKNKKSGILNGFEAGKIGNKNDDNFSKLTANDNFAITTFLRAI